MQTKGEWTQKSAVCLLSHHTLPALGCPRESCLLHLTPSAADRNTMDPSEGACCMGWGMCPRVEESVPRAFDFLCDSTHITLHTCCFPLQTHFKAPATATASVDFTPLAIWHLHKPRVAFTTALADPSHCCNGWGLLVNIHTAFCSGCLNLHDLGTFSERHANCTENQHMMMALYQACLADDT